MKNRIKYAGIIRLGIILSIIAAFGIAESNQSPDSEIILQKLRDNDATFDNLEIKYLQIGKHEIKPDRFESWRFGDNTSSMPEDYWKPRTVKWARLCSLTVNGNDAILASQFEPSLSEKDKYVQPGKYFREGNIDGVRYQLFDEQLAENDPLKKTQNSEKQLYIRKMRSPMEGLYDTRMAVEFAHGIGFGRRITKIDSVIPAGDGFRLAGEIIIWAEDISRFEIEIDQDYLVRKATINADVKGNHTRFEVHTKDTITSGGLSLAKSGHCRRSWQPTPEQEAKGTKSKVTEDFEVEFRDVSLNLSKERFAKLAEFKVEPLMQVEDDVHNIYNRGEKRVLPSPINGMP